MVFSLILLAPSWGGMINGDHDPERRLAQAARRPDPEVPDRVLSFYGMSTFEGPMMSIKTVNALSHYTDWGIGHVHAGALGWVGDDLDGLAVLPDPAPVRASRRCSAFTAIDLHFWVATIGIVLYIAAMWIAGVMQGLMWRAIHPDGTLTYSFVESVKATYPVLRGAPAPAAALPRRHADHGLERGT